MRFATILLLSVLTGYSQAATIDEMAAGLAALKALTNAAEKVTKAHRELTAYKEDPSGTRLRNEINANLDQLAKLGEQNSADARSEALAVLHRTYKLTERYYNLLTFPGTTVIEFQTALALYIDSRKRITDVPAEYKDLIAKADAIASGKPNEPKSTELKPTEPKPTVSVESKQPRTPATVYELRDGQKIRAVNAIETKDDYIVKTEDGKMLTLTKKDVLAISKQ